MMVHKKPMALGIALALSAIPAAWAESSQELTGLKDELARLRGEIEALKKEQRSQPGAVDSRVAALEQAQRDAVTKGDLPNSFKLPGSNMSVRVYGAMRADLIHDFRATAPGDLFNNLPEQPLDGSGATHGKTLITAQATRLGVRTSAPVGDGTVQTRLETDFYAYCGASLNANACNRNRLRIRHAYGEYAGWLIGQTFSTFMDIDTLPDTVDLIGPIGGLAQRRSMVRYSTGTPQQIKFSAALEDPRGGARTPDVVLRVDKAFTGGSVNLRLLSAETRAAAGYSKRGQGIGVAGSFEVSPKDLILAQFALVEGSDAIMWGSNGSVDTGQRVVLDRSRNANLGWTHRFGDRLRTNVIYGWTRSGAGSEFVAAYGAADANKLLSQAYVNMFYQPVTNVELGAEYTWGYRRTFSDAKGTLSRVNLMGKYSF